MTITKTEIRTWLIQLDQVYADNKIYLTELDSPIGDADHGINMARGFKAVAEKLADSDADIGSLLKTTGMTLIGTMGGASGPLYGTFFIDAANSALNKDEINTAELISMIGQGIQGLVRRGRAELDDKTMVDAWVPAHEALKASFETGEGLWASLTEMVTAAEEGMKATTPMLAKKGRASYLGERSIGHQDPGATSTYLMLKALAKTVMNDSIHENYEQSDQEVWDTF
ncbi:MAG: dihydroxyacetone kinase-like protein [Cellvibrionaceae bacterium]|jgi:dihydroxyacetone kinase-like protein